MAAAGSADPAPVEGTCQGLSAQRMTRNWRMGGCSVTWRREAFALAENPATRGPATRPCEAGKMLTGDDLRWLSLEQGQRTRHHREQQRQCPDPPERMGRCHPPDQRSASAPGHEGLTHGESRRRRRRTAAVPPVAAALLLAGRRSGEGLPPTAWWVTSSLGRGRPFARGNRCVSGCPVEEPGEGDRGQPRGAEAVEHSW